MAGILLAQGRVRMPRRAVSPLERFASLDW